MNDPRFPGAPKDAYISDEGWMILRDEAWLPEEWQGIEGARFRSNQRRSQHRIESGYYREYYRRRRTA